MMKIISWSLTCLLLLFEFTRSTSAEGSLCEVENGKSNITIDIYKGRGKVITQLITPKELPIIGNPYKEISLNLLFSTGKPLFSLNGKRLQFLEPLNKNKDNLPLIAFQVTCTLRNTQKKRIIPVIVRFSRNTKFISAPNKTTVTKGLRRKLKRTVGEQNVSQGPETMFAQPVYLQVSEAVPLNSTVAAVIALSPEKGPVTYSIHSGNDLKQFAIGYKSGVIRVVRKLDREVLSSYQLVVKSEAGGGFSSTVTVYINVMDVNDESPVFVDLPYELKVSEGEANKTVGFVHAVDLDEGVNAQVSYSLPTGVPFAINETSGEIITTVALDYETEKEHKFVVTAKDGAPNPLLGTATVTVFVQDVEDEVPFFNVIEYNTSVPENLPGFMIARVQAEDPDTVKKITYVMEQGPTDLFKVDSQTGELKCIKGLDYEKRRNYTITIGTAENRSNVTGSKVRIFIQVEDLNDIPPEFATLPEPVTLEDDVAIGTPVTKVLATDSDGTAPGNEVKYQLIGKRKAAQYFQIDPDSGLLSVIDDLRKETDTEYQVYVKAYDLGEPSLSSVATLVVYVRHTTTPPPEIGLGFSDDFYNVQVPENVTARQLIKVLWVINGNSLEGRGVPWNCSIISGNNEDLFYANVTPEKNCEVRLKVGKLDRETTEKHELRVKLDALQEFLNPQKYLTTLEIDVIDVNDNKPEFVFSSFGYKRQSPKVYYGAVSRDAGFGTHVLTVKAEDKDNGKFGAISYEIRPSDKESEYFTIDNTTGAIITNKQFDDVEEGQLPFMFYVLAKDNYFSPCCSNTNEVKIVVREVNLIDSIHRFILVLDTDRNVVEQSKNELEEILQENTGLIVGIEKFMPKQFLNKNESLEYDNSATDVWFYAIDPETEIILHVNQRKVQRLILDTNTMSDIANDVSRKINATVSNIRSYVETEKGTMADTRTLEVFTYTIVAVVFLLVLVLGMAAAIRMLEARSKFKMVQAIRDLWQELMCAEINRPKSKEYNSEVSSSFLWITALHEPIDCGNLLLPSHSIAKNSTLVFPQEYVKYAKVESNGNENKT